MKTKTTNWVITNIKEEYLEKAWDILYSIDKLHRQMSGKVIITIGFNESELHVQVSNDNYDNDKEYLELVNVFDKIIHVLKEW